MEPFWCSIAPLVSQHPSTSKRLVTVSRWMHLWAVCCIGLSWFIIYVHFKFLSLNFVYFFDREASFDKTLLATGTLWTGFPAGPSRGAVTRCIAASLRFKARIKTNANRWTFGLWTGKVHKAICLYQLRMVWIMILIDQQVTERGIYKSSMKIDSKSQVQRLGHVVKPKLWPPSLVEIPGASQSFRENSFST